MRAAMFVMMLATVACESSATPQPSPAPTPAHPTGPPADANPATMDATQLFATFCAQCHGPEAKGYKADHAPSLVNPTFLESASNAYITGSIERGRPGTSMAAYAKGLGGPLGPAEVEKLVQWLRVQGPPPKDLETASLGDATKGKALYAAQCQKCHGDQTTRGEYLLLANPRFLELASDAFIQHAIVNGRPGTPMESFAQKLDAAARADVLAYIRSLATTVTIKQLPAPTGKEPIFINPKGRPPAFTMKEGRFVSADQVKAALDKKQKLVIIDARPESEWMTVHITGAVSIPHYQLKRLDEIPKDAWIIAYCACPHHLSGIVVDELQKRGYTHAGVLDEGILDWQRRKFPIVAAEGVVTPPKEPSYPPGTIP